MAKESIGSIPLTCIPSINHITIICHIGVQNGYAMYLLLFACIQEACTSRNIYFAAAILKIQNGGHADISAIVINDFRIPHGLTFPKMYRFANFPKFWTKIHNEPDYWTGNEPFYCMPPLASISCSQLFNLFRFSLKWFWSGISSITI